MFIKYQHIERYGSDGVDNINLGTCYVQPKIDGTNGSIFLDEETNEIHAGSRNRELSLYEDNAGFFNSIKDDERFIAFLILSDG